MIKQFYNNKLVYNNTPWLVIALTKSTTTGGDIMSNNNNNNEGHTEKSCCMSVNLAKSKTYRGYKFMPYGLGVDI